MILHCPTDEGIRALREIQAQMAPGIEEIQQSPILRGGIIEVADVRLDEKPEQPPTNQ